MDMAWIMEIAAALAGQAHLGPVSGVTPLAAGGNNRVYRVDGAEYPLLLKHYWNGGERDRLNSEYLFAWYAEARGLPVPTPLARDSENGFALYRFVPGRALEPGEVTGAHVDQAVDFLVRLNLDRRGGEVLPDGAEACFSPMAHLVVVDRRLERLGSVDGEAGVFIRSELAPAWDRVRQQAEARLGDMDGPGKDQRMISPSDFGFHNALLGNDGRLVFMDFEYAGWDDAAKAVCDFFCQPAVPVPRSELNRFTWTLEEQPWADDRLADRVAALLPVYEVKWVTIMLNEFLPAGSRRRAFAAGEADGDERKDNQLAKAKRALEEVPI
jgi:hypothetical protein